MQSVFAICFAFVTALVPICAIGQDKVTDERINALIEQLVSKNPPPRELKGSAAEYPANYDSGVQKSVRAAYHELSSLGTRAFPELIKHFEDKRYALTADVGPMDKNFTVGHLCYYIVELQIQPDKGRTVGDGDPRLRKFRPHYPTHIELRDKSAAAKWWDENKGKSLVEIQIAVTEWTIAEAEKKSTDYTNEERSALRNRLHVLRDTNKPIPSTVPWMK